MLSPARRHRLKVLAAQEAAKTQNEFGGVRQDASVYQLQLLELKNDKNVLSLIKSSTERAKRKEELIPKFMPYIEGVISSGAVVEQDDVLTTVMVWCIDAQKFSESLYIAEYVLKNKIKMADAFSRDAASILTEEIGNAAHKAYQDGEIFALDVLQKVQLLTQDLDMHDQIRAKIFLAIGRVFLQLEQGSEAVAFLKMAIAKNERCGGKQDLQKAERLYKEQLKHHPEPMLNADGSQVVDDHGSLVFYST